MMSLAELFIDRINKYDRSNYKRTILKTIRRVALVNTVVFIQLFIWFKEKLKILHSVYLTSIL